MSRPESWLLLWLSEHAAFNQMSQNGEGILKVI